MPKDATKNIDRYKIRGGQLNEFEYAENQKAFAGKPPKGDAKLIPGTPPEEAVEGLRPVVKATSKATKTTKSTKKAQSSSTKGTKKSSTKGTKKATKSSTKGTKKAAKSSTRGATAKKLAARKTAARKK